MVARRVPGLVFLPCYLGTHPALSCLRRVTFQRRKVTKVRRGFDPGPHWRGAGGGTLNSLASKDPSCYSPVQSLRAVTNGGPRPPFERLLPGKTCGYLRLNYLVSAAGCALPQNKCHALVGLSVGATCGRPHAMVRHRAAWPVLHSPGGEWKFFLPTFSFKKK